MSVVVFLFLFLWWISARSVRVRVTRRPIDRFVNPVDLDLDLELLDLDLDLVDLDRVVRRCQSG
jgi:hypothetical protein